MDFPHGKSFVSVQKHTGVKDCLMSAAHQCCTSSGNESSS